MSNGALLIFNGGSSSLKFTLYETNDSENKKNKSENENEIKIKKEQKDKNEKLKKIIGGQIERITEAPLLTMHAASGEQLTQREWPANSHPHDTELVSALIKEIEKHHQIPLRAAGHRIVHGGPHYFQPTLLDEKVLAELEASVPLAPLHLPHNLAPIRAFAELYPKLPQIGCFDTGFHATMPRIEKLFGLPRELLDAGIVRYGFHGLSYEFISSQLSGLDIRAAQGRTIVAHLGNGASVCAMQNGKSVATSMGFSALDGLIMGTRCGSIDPGVLIYLLCERNYDAKKLEQLLYHECGLLGISGGISADVRDLLASDSPLAKEAIDLFCYRVVREIGAMIAVNGGIDALIFTGGIGQHAAPIRAAICTGLACFDIKIDAAKNAAEEAKISAANSGVGVWAIATDEEGVIAQHCETLLE
ncbi:MAG: acetate kinase [Verrucomicrobiaceae bacterium]|nr:acetate kinase [Verrucomicrobiaceae bacterium]